MTEGQAFSIEWRFRGPRSGTTHTAQGGYFSGRVSAVVPHAHTFILEKAIPLEKVLVVRVDGAGAVVSDGEDVVARLTGDKPVGPPPGPVSLRDAVEASRRFEGARHSAPECFACGFRQEGDGLRIYPGSIPDRYAHGGRVLAAGWQPHPAFLNSAGRLREEFVWAALDCPAAWAVPPGDGKTGTLRGEIFGPIDGHQPLIVMGWYLPAVSPREGSRSRQAGSAIFDQDGGLLALGAQTWVLDPPATASAGA